MSNATTILKFLQERNASCDDCIARETRIEPRQQGDQICRRLGPSVLIRRQDRCALCGHTKTVNVLPVTTSGAVTPPASPTGPTMPRDPAVRARLVCGKLDLNEVKLVSRVLEAAGAVLRHMVVKSGVYNN